MASTVRPDGVRRAGEMEGQLQKSGRFDDSVERARPAYISFIAQTTSSPKAEFSWNRAPTATTKEVPRSDDDERSLTFTRN